jgi:DNA helicase-4
LAKLQQRLVFRFLADPFGKSVRTMELDGDRIRIMRRGQVAAMSLLSLTSAPSVRKGTLGAALTISSDEHGDVTLRGAANLDAREFSEEVKKAWIRSSLAALERETVRLDSILAGVQSLAAPSSHPAACRVAPLLGEARALDAELLSKIRAEAVGPGAMARIAPVRKFVSDPRTARAAGISTFVIAELERRKDFFDTVESKELTPEQRLSVVVDEDATLVLAGAGSGKTSVVAAKATYLVRVGIRQPEEILLLAFGKEAAKQMSERVEAKSGVPMVARTRAGPR